MSVVIFKRSAAVAFLTAICVMSVGCGQQTNDTTQVSDESHEGHDHGGWWCAEHGIPEEECSMCSAQAAADFKEKGDWCEEHNRAEYRRDSC